MKSLLVYYSRTGTTKKVADAISDIINCDIEEIVDEKDRSGFLGFLVSFWEAMQKKQTQIQDIKKDPSEYDLVIIGSPTWISNTPPPIRTYLSQITTDVPDTAFFCTYGHAGYEKVFDEMKTLSGKDPVALLNLSSKDVKKEDNRDKVKNFVNGMSASLKDSEKTN